MFRKSSGELAMIKLRVVKKGRLFYPQVYRLFGGWRDFSGDDLDPTTTRFETEEEAIAFCKHYREMNEIKEVVWESTDD